MLLPEDAVQGRQGLPEEGLGLDRLAPIHQDRAEVPAGDRREVVELSLDAKLHLQGLASQGLPLGG